MTEPVIIGDCQLYLGDCGDIIPALSNIDAVVTSPPYNQMEGLNNRKPTGLWGDKRGGLGFVTAWQDRGYSDDLCEDDYQSQQNETFARIADVCNEGASLFYNHQLRWRDGDVLHPIQWFTPALWKLRSEIIWDRAGGMMFNARMFCRFDERILWFVRAPADIRKPTLKWKWNQEYVGLGTIWRMPREQNKAHPVAYPVELPINCIGATTDLGDTVFDPYMGSATTGAACIKMGRKFIGIEREPKYFDIACKRISEAYKQPDFFVAPPPEPKQEAML